MNLREIREKSQLKVEGMCNLLGICRTNYFAIERGSRKLSKGQQEILKEFMGSVWYERISRIRN